MDEDFYNTVHAERRQYDEWVRKEHNRIMAMRPGPRKQAAFNKLHRSCIALEGLTEQELNVPW